MMKNLLKLWILNSKSDDQIIDVQGDEPLVHPKYVEAVSSKLMKKNRMCRAISRNSYKK